MPNTMNIAGQIIEQLGGAGRLMAMVGASSFVNVENGVQFRFKGSKVANSVRIELDIDDTYVVKFFKIKGLDFKQTRESIGAHWSDLPRIFELSTGLALSL